MYKLCNIFRNASRWKCVCACTHRGMCSGRGHVYPNSAPGCPILHPLLPSHDSLRSTQMHYLIETVCHKLTDFIFLSFVRLWHSRAETGMVIDERGRFRKRERGEDKMLRFIYSHKYDGVGVSDSVFALWYFHHGELTGTSAVTYKILNLYT